MVDINYLDKLLRGKTDQKKKIIQLLIDQTPGLITDIKILVLAKEWKALLKQVHISRAYYGYLGNAVLNQKLIDWELAIHGNDENYMHSEMATELESKTSLIVDQLKKIVKEI